MYIHRLLLEKRPPGSSIVSSETDQPYKSRVKPGCTVSLRFREVRILAHIVELGEDEFYLGQVIEIDGVRRMDDRPERPIWPELQGLALGSFVRFREQNVFACHAN